MSCDKNLIQDFLSLRNIKFKTDEPIKNIGYLRVGGASDFVVYPKDEQELTELLAFLVKTCTRHKLVGKMSNLLPEDEGYRGVLIKSDALSSVLRDGEFIRVGCGLSLPSFSSLAMRYGLDGLAELSGIPASVGGAVYMNAGAYGREISDFLVSASVFDPEDGCVKKLSRQELCFEYRYSILKTRTLYLVDATFKLPRGDKKEISERMRAVAEKRRNSQPIAYPSLGSVFKKHKDISAGYLVDKTGMKGLSVGGASVSQKHAGFIINTGGASAKDYKTLVEIVKRRVDERFGITLCEEIEYLK